MVLNPGRVLAWCCLLACGGTMGGAPAPSGGPVDLTRAVLVLPAGLSHPEKQAAEMLVEEVDRRSQVRWTTTDRLPSSGQPAVVLGTRAALQDAFPVVARALKAHAAPSAEGYELLSLADGTVIVAGSDARGVLFGAGRLLRSLEYAREGVVLPSPLAVATAPRYPLRGHQLGYRPKTNSYDGWDVATWERYVRDLVIFGANAIEGIPPRSDDAADSPHFPLSQIRMLAEQSRLAQDYGIDFWIWYPALDKHYDDPAVVAAAVKEWGEVLRRLPKVDALFVPGGDPGRTPPQLLFPLLEKQAAQLRELHPGATLWVSPQGFSTESLEEFYRLLQAEPAWLEGIVFGPQQRESLEELRARVPRRYKIRFYPDITHTIACQYPVPDWDFAYAQTLNREPINPRPLDQAAIFRRLQPLAAHGVLTYSEGCNDDVNKFIWSGLAWDPDADVTALLRDYSRYFIGSAEAEKFVDGLLALERNWRGPLAKNTGVDDTLALFQDMERHASPALLRNWRFQQALYRAYYDATVRARLLAENAQAERALAALRRAPAVGAEAATKDALAALAPPAVRPAAEWRARVFELAEALFQSIHMQLSVPKYQAIATYRGANLDQLDEPIGDGPWLQAQCEAILALPTEAERLQLIERILHWPDPGPGGFYDDLGKAAASPHLVRPATYAEDPAYLTTPMTGFELREGRPRRVSSSDFAQTLYDQPLEMRYEGLDPSARYRLRLVYGDEYSADVRLVADGQWEIHPLQEKVFAPWPREFPIPAAATADGVLTLTWSGTPGRRGNGRGVQVAEVWLVREPAAARPPGR